MKLKKLVNLSAAICFTAALGCTLNVATAAETQKTEQAASSSETLSLLGGKQVFTLQGYEAQPVPGGAPGKMYVNKQAKRVLIIGEEDIPLAARAASEDDFLNGLKSIKDQQKQSSPAYNVVSEKTENAKGLKVYHIEATSNMDGTDVYQATLIAVANKKFTIIQVISNQKDKPGHIAAVNNILGK
ncbi:hypothetical protein KXR87_09635 [Yokenella regensburgei]|uniref:hypothetical protein n=1 Tax=Yokenella regensburgei TaxID=158877 RepID=UPI003F1479C1